jgi:hypothetical protein
LSVESKLFLLKEDQPHLLRTRELAKHLLRGAKVLDAWILEVLGKNADSVGDIGSSQDA